MASRKELEDQIARLTASVEEMRSRIDQLEGSSPRALRDVPRSRRELLRLGGAAALGAVGAATLRAMPVGANTGDNVVAGQANTADATTRLTGSGTTPPVEVLGVESKDFDSTGQAAAGTFSAPLQGLGTAGSVEGVDGWAKGPSSFGVYGLTDEGTGVTGESGIGISLYARGTGRIRQDPLPGPAGNPGYLPNPMEQVRDADGTLWLSNAQGNWRRASTFEIFPSPRRVYGKGVFLTKGAAVLNIDATTKLDGNPSGVPVGATAAWCAVGSYEPGVLSVYPAGTTDFHFGAFAQMGTAGLSIQVVYLMVPLNAQGKFSFTNLKSKIRVYFDVWGYLSQSA